MFPARLVLPQSRVPNPDLTVARVAAARGEAAVGAERQTHDRAGVTVQCDGVGRLGRLQVPHLHGRVPTSGGQVAAVGAESHSPDITPMPLQRPELWVSLPLPIHVPD